MLHETAAERSARWRPPALVVDGPLTAPQCPEVGSLEGDEQVLRWNRHHAVRVGENQLCATVFNNNGFHADSMPDGVRPSARPIGGKCVRLERRPRVEFSAARRTVDSAEQVVHSLGDPEATVA